MKSQPDSQKPDMGGVWVLVAVLVIAYYVTGAWKHGARYGRPDFRGHLLLAVLAMAVWGFLMNKFTRWMRRRKPPLKNGPPQEVPHKEDRSKIDPPNIIY